MAVYIPALSATNLIGRPAAVLPSDEEAAVLEAGHVSIVLFIPCPGIDLERFTYGGAVGIKALSVDLRIMPGSNKAAIA